jgi:hypothetical protein
MRALVLLIVVCSCATGPSATVAPLCATSPAIKASLSLSPPFTASALDGVLLRARVAGKLGNHISVSFVDDWNQPAGHLVESVDCRAIVVHYQPAWSPDGVTYYSGTKTQDIEALIGASQLIEIGASGTYPDADLQQAEDAFSRMYLEGGADAVACP